MGRSGRIGLGGLDLQLVDPSGFVPAHPNKWYQSFGEEALIPNKWYQSHKTAKEVQDPRSLVAWTVEDSSKIRRSEDG